MDIDAIKKQIYSSLDRLGGRFTCEFQLGYVRVYPDCGWFTASDLLAFSNIEGLHFVSCVFANSNICALFKISDF